MSKGSRQRPTDLEKFRVNYDSIFRRPSPQEIDDAVAEDEAFRLVEEQRKSQVRDSDQGG